MCSCSSSISFAAASVACQVGRVEYSFSFRSKEMMLISLPHTSPSYEAKLPSVFEPALDTSVMFAVKFRKHIRCCSNSNMKLKKPLSPLIL